VASDYAQSATRSQELAAKNLPKQSDAMIASLSGAITQVVDAVSGSMKSIYGPIHEDARQSAEQGTPPMAPWYGDPTAMDFSDPTDGLINEGISDPAASGNLDGLILPGDDEPFGIPGLKVEG
jgi:hypothetical protein